MTKAESTANRLSRNDAIELAVTSAPAKQRDFVRLYLTHLGKTRGEQALRQVGRDLGPSEAERIAATARKIYFNARRRPGKPRLAEGEETVRLGLKIPRRDRATLRDAAAVSGETVSEILRRGGLARANALLSKADPSAHRT
ncbi:MAG TPA: hypothetical protein ENK57_08310 [Polyangiaceae bacterium]|nr:hypothetical protein [Polyangiaceae bacterium]